MQFSELKSAKLISNGKCDRFLGNRIYAMRKQNEIIIFIR